MRAAHVTLALAFGFASIGPTLAKPTAEQMVLLIAEGLEDGTPADRPTVTYATTATSPARMEMRVTTDGKTEVQEIYTVTQASACRYIIDRSFLTGVTAGDGYAYSIDFSAITGMKRVPDGGIELSVFEASGAYCAMERDKSGTYGYVCAPYGDALGQVSLARNLKAPAIEAAFKTFKTEFCR
jgi:hypothetical protein